MKSHNAGRRTLSSSCLTVAILLICWGVSHFSFAATCVPPPNGLVSWWRAENNAADFVDGNSGFLSNGVTFASGEVGQGFNLDGTSGYVRVNASASLNVGLGNGLTIECIVL